MIKPKVVQRNVLPPGLRRGTTVTMSDGWRGTVEQDCGEFIVCLAAGERADPLVRRLSIS